jgi:hypothetical protein
VVIGPGVAGEKWFPARDGIVHVMISEWVRYCKSGFVIKGVSPLVPSLSSMLHCSKRI